MATLTLPVEIKSVLAKNKTAHAKFNALSPSHQREYINFVSAAKKPETRTRRAAQMIKMLAEVK